MQNDVTLPGVSLLVADAFGQGEFEFELTPELAERYELKSPDLGSPKRNTKRVGDISEAHVIAAFAKLGYHVLLPFGENHRYDLVVDDGERLFRVQVKTGRLRRDGTVIEYSCSSSHAHRGGASRPYFGEIDYLAVYCPGTQKVYLLPEKELTATRAHLRLSPPRNNMSKSIRWASRYELA
ncbi:MAG TPA: group I intron-associated PD-(D/E)XK endonuclease [Candidatus Limnocylindrales bacterium]|nr:group I intron-associated PD-(D/E)XK endonuclease [Candidatus Limnocylindrales bacterium]